MEITKKRTDVHKPSLADPAHYAFTACFYQGGSDAMQKAYAFDHREYDAALAKYETFKGNHDAKSTCDHCGAAFAHGVLFLHTPSQHLVHIGHICAGNTIGLPSRAAAVRKSAEKAAAAAKEQEKMFAETADWRADNADVVAWLDAKNIARAEYGDAMAEWNDGGCKGQAPKADRVHPFICDMIHTKNRYGGLTERQTDATRKFMASDAKFAEAAANREPDPVPEEPVPTGRVEIIGKVLTTKWKDSMYGETLKMLVMLDDGNKVWGTVPAVLEGVETLKGSTIIFTATVTRSDDDPHFGFFKRPSGAEIVVAKEESA